MSSLFLVMSSDRAGVVAMEHGEQVADQQSWGAAVRGVHDADQRSHPLLDQAALTSGAL